MCIGRVTIIPKIIHLVRMRTHINDEYVYYKIDLNCRIFIETNYSWFLDTYDKYCEDDEKINCIKYFYMYHYGGIYNNISQRKDEIHENNNNNNNNHDVVLFKVNGMISDEIIISKPRQKFWTYVFYTLIYRHLDTGNIEYCSGGQALEKAYELYKNSKVKKDKLYKKICDHLSLKYKPDSNKTNICVDDI